MSIEELAEPPALGPLYRTALAESLRRRPPGADLPDHTLVVPEASIDLGRLAEYDRVCGYRLSDELPATYPHVLAFPLAVALMTHPGFPLPLLGLVHVANSVELRRPVGAAERLGLRVHAENLRPHERGRQFDIVAEASVDGDVVWVGRSVYLRRERPSGDAAQTGKQRTGEQRPREAAPRPCAIWRLGTRVGQDYARVSGDRNPIHTSLIMARAFGFPRPIAHGMWSAARCLAALEGRLPAGYTFDVAFKLPIPLPARVGFAAVPEDAGWRVSLHDTRSGKPHLTGTVAGLAEPAAEPAVEMAPKLAKGDPPAL